MSENVWTPCARTTSSARDYLPAPAKALSYRTMLWASCSSRKAPGRAARPCRRVPRTVLPSATTVARLRSAAREQIPLTSYPGHEQARRRNEQRTRHRI